MLSCCLFFFFKEERRKYSVVGGLARESFYQVGVMLAIKVGNGEAEA